MPIGENQVGAGKTIEYSPLTSCVTATCLLDNATLAGAHFVWDQRQHAQNLIENDLAQLVGTEVVNKIYLVGVTSCWREDEEQRITYFKLMEWLCNQFKTYDVATSATAGEGEIVTVTAKSKTKAQVTVTTEL